MSQQISVRHKFAGGWATDFGPLWDQQPSALGGNDFTIDIPYLRMADNVFYELDGAPHKEYGTSELFSTALETDKPIKGMFDYWIMGTSGTPAQHRILSLFGKIYKDDADASFSTIFTGLTDGAIANFSQFDDILIIANDATADVPKSWDGTTAQNLAGTPPNFAWSHVHSSHVFAGGVAANPSTLYWCVPFDPEDWISAGSGNLVVDPQDGDRLTGVISFKQRLLVFKGPNKGSIHIITGTSSDDFAKVPLVRGIGAVHQNSIVQFGNDVLFLWNDGHIYSLGATDQFGDFKSQARITENISRWIDEHVNLTRLAHASMAVWPSRGLVLCALPIDGSTQPNFILMIDMRFNPPRLAAWPAFSNYTYIAPIIDASSKKLIVMGGGADSKVYNFGASQRALEEVNRIAYRVETPFFTYGNPFLLKTLQSASIGFSPHASSGLDFQWTRDDNPRQQTTFLTKGGGDVLGSASANQFTLGTSTLGGQSFVEQYIDIENGGQFRSVSYRIFENELNVDTEIHAFSTVFEIDGPSWEN